MTDLKISQFTDGGIIEETDIIAAVRSGVNTKVTVGSAATADIGSADEEVPDGSIVNQKIADALAVYTPPPAGDGNYGVITITSGVWDFTDGTYGDIDISSNSFDIVNPPLASIKNLTTSADQGIRLTASDTYATYSLTSGGVALSGITGTALTVPYFSSTNTAGNLTFIDDDTFATATATSLSSSESIKAYVDASANGGIIILPAQATTSGTSKDFTIPAGAKKITVMLDGVSTNGGSSLLIQLGTSGGIVTTGYRACSISGGSNQAGTTGFNIFTNVSGAITGGAMNFNNISGNTWVAEGSIARSDVALLISGGGAITLAAPLTTVRFTTVNGTDLFDLGQVGVAYQL